MNIGAEAVTELIFETAGKFRATQMSNTKEAAKLLSARLMEGGIIFVFGAGHSRTFGMEMCGRAGGLVPMRLIGLEDIAAAEGQRGINLVELERDPHTAHRLFRMHDIRNEDALILVSNSGRNGSTVELAMECKKRGIPSIAVTSLEHTSQTSSRHPSGKRLYEIADRVIDNCCPYGDVLMDVPGVAIKTGSASTVVGAMIAQALTNEIVAHYIAAGETPPIYISANVDGGDEHNRQLVSRYRHRNITY